MKIKLLQSNNNPVFLSQDFQRYLDLQGTKRKLTVHHTLQQNGVAECTHKTIFRGVQAYLTSTKLPLIL